MDKTHYQHSIHESLQAVAEQRQHCARDPAFALHLSRLKRYQAARLQVTYADLHVQERYRAAVDFFTQDLYGDRDFSERDADLVRIVPAVARLFPLEAVATLDAALRLHAISENLDTRMCEHNAKPWREDSYQSAWCATGHASLRQEQLALVIQVGHSLDKLVKLPMIGMSLRAMSGPAHVAGLSELHGFLSRGYAAFKALKGAAEFLNTIELRESVLMQSLFSRNLSSD
jgi:hypothetical protein